MRTSYKKQVTSIVLHILENLQIPIAQISEQVLHLTSDAGPYPTILWEEKTAILTYSTNDTSETKL